MMIHSKFLKDATSQTPALGILLGLRQQSQPVVRRFRGRLTVLTQFYFYNLCNPLKKTGYDCISKSAVLVLCDFPTLQLNNILGMSMTKKATNSRKPQTDSITIIKRSKGWLPLNLREVWSYRELLLILVWRNTVVRYKQSVAGISWALIKPVTSMVVFSLIFGRIASLPSDGIPYPIFTYVALLPWGYFSGCLVQTSNSLVGGANLLRKVYFPRLILPMSHIFTGLIDFMISFIVLIGMMGWYRDHITLSWRVATLPLFLILAMLSAFAIGLWLSALMVRYRDIAHMLPFITQIWQYLTPVAYTASLVPDTWRLYYAINPLANVINGFRWALLGLSEPHWLGMIISTVSLMFILIAGLYYFRYVERTMVDVV